MSMKSEYFIVHFCKLLLLFISSEKPN